MTNVQMVNFSTLGSIGFCCADVAITESASRSIVMAETCPQLELRQQHAAWEDEISMMGTGSMVG